jgi:thiosulfate reductase cytochrome b subunit
MSKVKNTVSNEEKSKFMPFRKDNYMFLLIGLVFIIIGFILMIGGSSENVDVFDEGIYSFRRITLSPILIVIGFVIEIYAIMKKPKQENKV